jgi:hypothetical protein
MSETLSSGGALKATSFERSPRVFAWFVVELADPKSPAILNVRRRSKKAMKSVVPATGLPLRVKKGWLLPEVLSCRRLSFRKARSKFT